MVTLTCVLHLNVYSCLQCSKSLARSSLNIEISMRKALLVSWTFIHKIRQARPALYRKYAIDKVVNRWKNCLMGRSRRAHIGRAVLTCRSFQRRKLFMATVSRYRHNMRLGRGKNKTKVSNTTKFYCRKQDAQKRNIKRKVVRIEQSWCQKQEVHYWNYYPCQRSSVSLIILLLMSLSLSKSWQSLQQAWQPPHN